ncbi:hypothetical protein B0T16DRAFT_396412 [Cercophora newfieldiana]|uniref:Uncharacterized protein n=1 Tax=Cercophora newfieldiana TaxID=92897 RepID=A0AA40CZR1_9PEZI|nr:hypothetical protein B0T16DRAFT_396412 [Cercophora newfieldiana]
MCIRLEAALRVPIAYLALATWGFVLSPSQQPGSQASLSKPPWVVNGRTLTIPFPAAVRTHSRGLAGSTGVHICQAGSNPGATSGGCECNQKPDQRALVTLTNGGEKFVPPPCKKNHLSVECGSHVSRRRLQSRYLWQLQGQPSLHRGRQMDRGRSLLHPQPSQQRPA